MAMPSSGSIRLRDSISGIPCSSIACAVNGTVAGNCSLSSLSVIAGKTSPHCMSEFYGYSSTSPVYLTTISSFSDTDNAYCVMRIDGLTSGSVTLGTCWETFSNGGYRSCVSICMVCNGICAFGNYTCENNQVLGFCVTKTISSSDNVCYVTRVCCGVQGITGTWDTQMCIATVTGNASYYRGTPYINRSVIPAI